jgi:endonuclease/exonuclease/phosphatase family metal-dependent hydrolase
MRLIIGVVLLVAACGGSNEVKHLTAPPGELTAITYNMYYGLAADLVPEDVSTGSLTTSATAVINATSLTDYQCRIDVTASQIVAEDPDVIGLQEALLIAFARELDDPSNDRRLVDFIDQLTDAIVRAGGPRYQVFQRRNAVLQDSLPLFGGIRIADRGAILVHPRLAAKEVGSLTYEVLEPASELGGNGGVVVRGALHVQVPFSSGTLDFYTTHLQSGGDPAVRDAQATELDAWIAANSAPDGTIVLMGDLNDVDTSPAVMTLTTNLVDTYATVGTPPGFTAYQTQTLNDPVDQANQRIDYILVRASDVEDSRVIFNAQAGPCNLWPSDHFGVVSRFKTAASPPPARPSE